MLSSTAFLGVVTGNGHKVAALLRATIFFPPSSVISMGFPGASRSKESVISLLFHIGMYWISDVCFRHTETQLIYI